MPEAYQPVASCVAICSAIQGVRPAVQGMELSCTRYGVQLFRVWGPAVQGTATQAYHVKGGLLSCIYTINTPIRMGDQTVSIESSYTFSFGLLLLHLTNCYMCP